MARKSFRRYLRGLRKKGGLIFFPCAIFAFTTPNAAGAEEITGGLTYSTYEFLNGTPQIPSPTDTPLSSGIVSGINFDWGGGEIFDSGRHEQVVVSFDGWINPPSTETYYICAYSDDGFQLYLDEVLVIPDWWDRGPQCGSTADVDFSDGQAKKLTAYYYENGGGAVAQLRYYIGEGVWMPIPDSWYSLNDPVATTTTTTSTTTTSTTTTTTVPATPLPPPENSIFLTADEGWQLSAEAPFGVFTEVLFASYGTPDGETVGSCHASNSLELVAEIFLGNSSGTIDANNSVFGDPCGGVYKRLNVRLLFEGEPATTTTTPETTTTTQVPIIIPPAPPVVVPPAPETSVPTETTPPETTIPETTAPVTTVPETTPPETTNPDPEPSLAPQPETETTVNEPEQPATSIEEQPSEEPVSEPETDEETPQEESEPPLEEELEEGPSDLLEQALAEGSVSNLSADQIAQVFDASTLESLSDEEISQLIESINPEELTEEQAEALAAALSAAPDKVKAEFESQINVFNGTFDSYVPKGSTISVGQRRLIVAATCVVFAMPAPAVSRSRGV